MSAVEITINVTFTAVISNSASPSHWKESYVLKIPFLKIIFDLSLLHDSRFKKNTFLILLRHFVKVQLFNCPMIWHIFLFMIINKIVICFKKKIVYRNIFHVVRMNLFIQIKMIKWRLIYWKVYVTKIRYILGFPLLWEWSFTLVI